MKKLLNIIALAGLAAAAVGCSEKEATSTKSAPAAPDAHASDDHHGHGAGPNGGTILEWGGGAYHLEFTVDHDAKSSTVYVLGGDAETPEPIKAETLSLTINEPAFQTELTADPLDGEGEGMSSRFTGTHEKLGTVREFAGTITAEVDGTPYSADFAEEAGDHEH